MRDRIKSTFFGLLGMGDEAAVQPNPEQLERLRQAMLQALGEPDSGHYDKVARQLRYAVDVRGLWYARSDLMALLADRHGETAARAELERLTEMFRELLPKSMTAGSGRRPG